jgi:hypothetical protein
MIVQKENRSRAAILFFSSFLVLLCGADATLGQAANSPSPLLKRTSIKTDRRPLGYGGRVTLVGAPVGSVTIEGWKQSDVEITAEIELQAPTEADLALLATVTGFGVDEQLNSIGIITTGTHDKGFMKKNAKNFPKKLLGLPWSISYHLKVPQLCDLDVNVGKGSFSLTAVEGGIAVKAQESDATFNVTGGDMIVAVGSGTVTFNVLGRGWRGRGAEVQIVTGKLSVNFPSIFNAYVNAQITRTGEIENSYAGLKPMERTTATPKSITGRAGTGGAMLSLKVGDGSLRIAESPKPD